MEVFDAFQLDPEHYQQMVESLKDYAMFSTDKEGIITSWNAGAERIFMYTDAEILGSSGEVLYTPEDIAANVPGMEMQGALTDGRAINERFHVKKNRDLFWGSGLVFPLFDRHHKHIGFTKVMRNVSDEDQAKANLREEQALAETIVYTFDEPMVILNPELTVINATAEFIDVIGIEKQKLIGKNLYQLTDGYLNIAKLRALLDPILKHNDFHSSFDLEYEDPIKGYQYFIVKPRRIYQPPNVLFSLEFEDQTSNKAVMDEKDIFISVASHEIRTPISVIRAYGQILQKELHSSKPIIRKAVQKINEQIEYLSSLITALLDTSKLTTGKLVLEREVFNLCNLVKEQSENFALTQSSHDIVVENEVDSLVLADKVRIGSVVTNLLSNAVKYSPESDEVRIKLEADEHSVKVSVQDFGLGIPSHEQNKLFKRFGRTEQVRNSKIPGTGLGLHLAAEIIKMEGGEIGFSTEEGKGSTFYFVLPLYT